MSNGTIIFYLKNIFCCQTLSLKVAPYFAKDRERTSTRVWMMNLEACMGCSLVQRSLRLAPAVYICASIT